MSYLLAMVLFLVIAIAVGRIWSRHGQLASLRAPPHRNPSLSDPHPGGRGFHHRCRCLRPDDPSGAVPWNRARDRSAGLRGRVINGPHRELSGNTSHRTGPRQRRLEGKIDQGTVLLLMSGLMLIGILSGIHIGFAFGVRPFSAMCCCLAVWTVSSLRDWRFR